MTHSIQINEFNSNDVITQVNNQLITTSKLVAETFGKLHKNILQKIESIECSDEFASANFSAHVQKLSVGNGAVRESKIYNITKDGFMFLVMGFTGKKAARIKEAYINAFNDMEAMLFNPAPQESLLLTYKQQRHIQSVVGVLAYQHEKSANSIYHDIYKKFDVTSYTHIPKDLYPDVCAYLSAEPKWELMDRVDSKFVARPIACQSYPKRSVLQNNLMHEEMFDCGWNLQLNKMINFVNQCEQEGVDYKIQDIAGLKQEVLSLCAIIERQDRRLKEINRLSS